MPQILKREIKENILISALDSFLDKGFRNTSMLDIARKAGIAAGNIYNYFENKEDVFTTLITPVLAEVKAIFGGWIGELPRMSRSERMGIAQKKMDAFIKVYLADRKVFVLLFEKSDSTKFETTRADVISNLSSVIIEAKNSLTANPATPEQETLIHAFAAAYIGGIISILTAKTDEDTKLHALHQFLPFMRSRLINSLR